MIHNRLQGDLSSKPEWLTEVPTSYTEAMQRRMAVANGQLCFLQQNRFGCGYLVDYGVFDIPTWRGWRTALSSAPIAGLQRLFLRRHLSRLQR